MVENEDQKFQDPNKWRRAFSGFLKHERKERARLSLDNCPQPTQSSIEADTPKKVPDLAYLLRLLLLFSREAKYKPSSSTLSRLFVLWILARIEHVSEQPGFKDKVVEDASHRSDELGADFDFYWGKYGREVQARIQDVLWPLSEGLSLQTETEPSESFRHLPTLAHFPEAFRPLTVVVGGYVGGKNHEPTHVGELFRQSQSFINLHYLLQLNLPPDTDIVSDRLLLDFRDDHERAHELLGDRHVLVIGSPLVNSVSRHLIRNRKLVFNFVFEKETYHLGENFYDDIKNTGLLDTPDAVVMFHRMMETQGEIDIRSPEFSDIGINKERREKIKNEVIDIRSLTGNPNATNDEVVEYFRPKQYFSPFEPKLHYCKSEPDDEFAVISLGENFWANLLRRNNTNLPGRALIAVCGADKISTAVALKALRQKNRKGFTNRPLGGVLKIRRSGLSGLKRVSESRYNWLDSEYEAQDVLTRIDDISRSLDEHPDAFSPLFNSTEELEAYREIVKQYVEEQ